MKNEDFTKMNLEELKKKEKSAQTSASLLFGIIIVQTIVGVYLTITDKFSVFTIMPVLFIPVLLMSFNNLKRIRQEIASRG